MSVIQSVYVALFGRPADPGGLAYWIEQTNNGADLSVMLDVLPSLPEYQQRFSGLTNEQIVNTIYQQLFNRDAEPAGSAYFVELLASGAKNLGDIAVTILQSAQGTDKEDVDAKVDAAILFTASLDTPEKIAAYTGTDAAAAAKAFLDGVDRNAPATQAAVDEAVQVIVGSDDPDEEEPGEEEPGEEEPGEGQEPGEEDPGDGQPGDGANNPPPQLPSAAIWSQDGKLTIANGAQVTITEASGNLTVSAAGFRSFIIDEGSVSDVVIAAASRVNISQSVRTDAEFSGSGTLNLTGVTFDAPESDQPIGSNTSFDPGAFEGRFLVNGNQADAFKLLWISLDAAYYADPVAPDYYNTSLNLAKIKLAEAYIDYLQDGGPAILDIVQTRVGSVPNADDRQQTLHDNILAEISNAAISDRFEEDPRSEDAKYFGNRPVEGGSQPEASNSDEAWDYANGISRSDYITATSAGAVDPSGQSGEKLFFGGGNTVDGFNIVRHEGAGVELALKAKVRKGADYEAELDENGVAVYRVDTGTQTVAWPDGVKTAADWNFDFSVVTGLNGTEKDLKDFTFVIRIDTLADDDVNFVNFTFDPAKDGGVWQNIDDVQFGGDDFGGAQVEQNSVNFGFKAISDLLEDYSIGSEGNFDIQLAAYDGTELIGLNKIRVIAEDLIDV